MTNLSEVANMDWEVDLVFPNRAGAGSGIVNRLEIAIHRIWNILDADWNKWVTMEAEDGQGEDANYYPAGGCCCFWSWW